MSKPENPLPCPQARPFDSRLRTRPGDVTPLFARGCTFLNSGVHVGRSLWLLRTVPTEVRQNPSGRYREPNGRRFVNYGYHRILNSAFTCSAGFPTPVPFRSCSRTRLRPDLGPTLANLFGPRLPSISCFYRSFPFRMLISSAAAALRSSAVTGTNFLPPVLSEIRQPF